MDSDPQYNGAIHPDFYAFFILVYLKSTDKQNENFVNI